MGEGIYLFGIRARTKGVRTLQSFVNMVLADGLERGRQFQIGFLNRKIVNDLKAHGVGLKSNLVVMTDKTVIKYLQHGKQRKGAVIDFGRFHAAERAIKHPTGIYRDKTRGILVYVYHAKGYAKGKSLKIVVEPNYKLKRGYVNRLKSIGVVDTKTMRGRQYEKIK